MLLLDVNVLIYAMRRESPHHRAYRRWLQERLAGDEPVGIGELALSAVLRIVTNHRIYLEPSSPAVALDFCRAVLGAPAAVPVRPGERHWQIFERLVRDTRARGNDVPDCYFAALALENGAGWVTADRGFARFDKLRLVNPLAAP